MRTTLILLSGIALTGLGLAVSYAQQPSREPSNRTEQFKPGLIAQVPVTKAAPPAAAPAAPAAQPAPAAPVDPKEVPVRTLCQAFANAYTTANVEALSALFTDDASVIDTEGSDVRGKAAITEMYATTMQDVPGVKLEADIAEVKFLTPEVARVEGRTRLATPSGDANEFTRFSALAVAKAGTWKIAEIRDYPAPATDVTPYERLQELEWMVGDWVDEDENTKVSANIKWADNQSYLIRTYSLHIKGDKASSGTMFIGWDPQSAQIKSWVFDSEGGHGEGLWTRSGDNQWVVKAQGVLRDGRPSSATQIHTVLNKDSVKTSSIDRIIGGQIAPDIADVVMVRKPPQPAAAK